jgi:hypothetical protein
MVGLLRGLAGARSQRPARHQRLGHSPDWPTQPRPEGLCRSVPIFLRLLRAVSWGIPLFSVGTGAVVVTGKARVNSSRSRCAR